MSSRNSEYRHYDCLYMALGALYHCLVGQSPTFAGKNTKVGLHPTIPLPSVECTFALGGQAVPLPSVGCTIALGGMCVLLMFCVVFCLPLMGFIVVAALELFVNRKMFVPVGTLV